MSRSRKKVAGWVDRNPFAKNQANKCVRRYKHHIPNGGSYKHLYEQWSICDWKMLYFTPGDLRRLGPRRLWKAYAK